MAELFATARIVDIILVLVALEVIALFIWRHRTGKGLDPAEILANIAAGFFLMLALRAALVDASWIWIAAALAAALVAHLIDLSRRWKYAAKTGARGQTGAN